MRQKPSLKRFAQVATFNTVIAVGISAFGAYDWFGNLVFSQCIGLSIWVLVDFGQFWLIKDLPRQLPRLFLIVPICSALGYFMGSTLAGLLLPQHNLDYWSDNPRRALGFLVISLMAGVVSSYFFMSREQLATAREDAERTQRLAEAAQRQATQAQLRLLQSQLEPHMLFNTLANLRALIALDPSRAQDMLDRIVAYLRATLNSSRATVHPLQAEFERLRDYLELIAVRMGPRLRYTLDLPTELASLPIPSLLLQPLVENAIKHGLEPKVQGGSVSVCAHLRDGWLTLEVRDTGIGLPLGQPAQDGFGLTQVRERLVTTYGPQATINVAANTAGGTCVTVIFPVNESLGHG